MYSNIQLEKGSEATEYTPHKGFGYESGSNENGNWIKYDDGTMICYGNKAVGEVECVTEWGGLYQGTADNLITYPQEFIEVKHLEITAIPTTSSSFWTMMRSREYLSTGYSGMYFIRPSAATISPFISWKAIGRWK